MPSARIHEIIAKKINKEYNMDETLLRLGSIAPDSWRNIKSKDAKKDKHLTHFWDFSVEEGQANDYKRFYSKYYDEINNPFYFGYLVHLITDQYWKTFIDPKYFFKENGIKKCVLKDGTIVEDKDWFSYYEGIKIQKKLCKKYNLGLLPVNREDVPNLKCNIEELDLSGLFGPNGTVSYLNNKLKNTDNNDEESILYDYNIIEKQIDETTSFVKKELNELIKE